MLRTLYRSTFVLLAMVALSAKAQDTTPELLAAAVKEGKVVWYTSVDVKVAEAVAKAFRTQYPNIQIEVERSGSERVFQRIGQELQSNIRNVDVQMTRLRRKIERDPRFPRYLQTVRGTGYTLKVD